MVEDDTSFSPSGDDFLLLALPWVAIWDEGIIFIKLSWRVIVMVTTRRSIDIISYMFLGSLGEKFMAAAGLANVTANVIGNSIVIGLGGALTTICSQAYGAKNNELLNFTLQRALAILILICIPLSVSWVYSRGIMIALGQSDDIATLASKYLMYLIPGLFSNAVSICFQGWLHSQQITEPQAIIGFLTAMFHPIWCYLFVFSFNFSYLGTAFAISTTRFLEALLLIFYTIYFSHFKRTNFHISFKAMFSDWNVYLQLGIPNILMTSQWWAEEIIIFLSGTFSTHHADKSLAAMAIYQYMIGICYILPKSVGTVSSSRVGYHLGNQDVTSARLSTYISFLFALCIGIFQSLLIFLCRKEIGYIFTNEIEVVELIGNSLMYVLCIYVIADGIQGVLSGVLNGMGRQQLAGPVVFLCYYIFGIPIAYYLGTDSYGGFGLHVLGLTIGVTAGTWLHGVVYTYIVYTTDWKEQVFIANQRNSSTMQVEADLPSKLFPDSLNSSSSIELMAIDINVNMSIGSASISKPTNDSYKWKALSGVEEIDNVENGDVSESVFLYDPHVDIKHEGNDITDCNKTNDAWDGVATSDIEHGNKFEMN